MSDFVVRLEDVFSPKLYTRYNSLDFLTKNVYFNSGVAFADPRIDRLMGSSEGGQLIQLPFLKNGYIFTKYIFFYNTLRERVGPLPYW